MSTAHGTRAVLAALAANLGIALAKFVGFLLTGSASMLAESVHSVADTSNQALLLLGKRTARRTPTAQHQFGFGRARYFYAFVVALLLFTAGSAFAVYEGVHKIQSPEPLTSPLVAVLILVVALALEGVSLRTAVGEAQALKGQANWWTFIRQTKNPELAVVLLEDLGALIGLVLALGAVAATELTGNAVWDGVGTVGIGVLLGGIAVVLIVETKSLLIGEGAQPAVLETIVEQLRTGRVERVIHIRTEYLGPDELLVAAKIGLTASLPLRDVASEIDAAEARVRAKVPAARLIYLEPDLDRSRFAAGGGPGAQPDERT